MPRGAAAGIVLLVAAAIIIDTVTLTMAAVISGNDSSTTSKSNNNNNTRLTQSTNREDYHDDDNNNENKNRKRNNKNDNDNSNYNSSSNNNNNSSSSYASSAKRIIIGGIPGVGKTSVISMAVKALNEKGQNTKVVVFGTEMFEEAKRTAGIKNRDELRKLSVKDQRRLQDLTARRIANMHDDVVVVDTHVFVRTGEGYYYPGLPMQLLDIIKPTGFVMIVAKAAEIVSRRKKDTSRNRDAVSMEQVQYEIDISKLMVATCSILTGAPFIIVDNNDNKMEEAIYCVARVLSKE